MHINLHKALLTLLLLASKIDARSVVDELSFGHRENQRLSNDGHTIPGWTLTGADGFEPDILSDRVILTPPQPGSERGALWANPPNSNNEWTAELDFRVSGPERAQGNLAVWYTKEKLTGANEFVSPAGVDRFDGLALLVDQHGGSGGAVTAFLSDGQISFKNHHSVHSLAFGRCNFAYRNLGRPSKLKMRQGQDGFEVLIDDKRCFKSEKVRLPSGYYFGIHASSAETPDSFEVYKFLVTRDNDGQQQGQVPPPPPSQQQQQFNQQPLAGSPMQSRQDQASPQQGGAPDPRVDQALQQLREAMNFLTNLESRSNDRHNEILRRMGQPGGSGISPDQLVAISQRIEKIEKNVEDIKKDVEGKDYRGLLQDIQHALDSTQDHLFGLPHLISSSAPRMGFFLFLVLTFQALLAASYIVYKRRRSMSPKKLL